MGDLSLPSEVWTNVFGYLSVEDKHNVRVCCKYFKRLVDHASLWKGWVLVLGLNGGSYNSQFWGTLRRRRVTSAVVRSRKTAVWKQLADSLPELNTLVMDRNIQQNLGHLRDLPKLTCLVLTRCQSSIQLDASVLSTPELLTCLSLCDVTLQTTRVDRFVAAVSQFRNLSSLTCHHCGIIGRSLRMIQSLLACLPRLAHLSLTPVDQLYAAHCHIRPAFLQTGHGAPVLSSLELLDCSNDSLPSDGMRLVPNLKKLSVVYAPHDWCSMWSSCTLKAWLEDLPHLSSLTVVRGPPVSHYAHLLPATVTNLALSVTKISSEDMTAVGKRLPELLHLHVDSRPWGLGALTADIPQLFPKLKSLKLRYELLVSKYLLELHKLRDLRSLELLNNTPGVSDFGAELQILTNNRIKVGLSSHRRDPFACSCVSHSYR